MSRSQKSKSRGGRHHATPAEAADPEEQDPVEETDEAREEAPAEAPPPAPAPAQEEEEPEQPEEEEEDEVQEEQPPPVPKEKPQKGRLPRKPGANIQVTARGDAESVATALQNLSPRRAPAPAAPAAPKEREEAEDEGLLTQEQLVRLLSDPKNVVTVYRTYPKRFQGVKCDTKVGDPYRCPTSLEDMQADIFNRFGGKKFTGYIHPAGPLGQHKILAAVEMENPDTSEPVFESSPGEEEIVYDPRFMPKPADGSDPTARPEEDPFMSMESDLKKQMRVTSRQVQLENLKAQLKELKSKKGEVEEGVQSRDTSSEDKLLLIQMENNINRRIDQIQGMMDRIASSDSQPKSDGNDTIMKMLLAQQKSSDDRFNTMMTAFMTAMTNQNKGREKDDFDAVLDRLAKMKNVFGHDDPRSKRLEDMAMDFFTERVMGNGGDGDGEESDVKYAVKQLVPVVKTFVDKKLSEPAAEAPTKEQFNAAVQQEATRVIQGLIQQGKLELKQHPPGLPAPHPKIGAPQEKRPAAAKPAEPPAAPKEPAPREEEPEMSNVPPEPGTPGYDRKKAVDFVLDSILHDIDAGFPEESFVVGDALDRLDDEILDQLLTVATGEDLEKVVGPHCTPAKIQAIKDRGRNPRVKTWLTRVITTIQDEYRREVESPAKEPEGGKA